jgi:phenylpyruvate tautomerase PptA (4-oxalocrotonate tautomerase family)
MPLMTIRTNARVDGPKTSALLKACSAQLARELGKPEHYVMTMFQPAEAMTMSGTDDPACLVEIRSVGAITPPQAKAMSEAMGRLIEQHLGVASDRVYINFEAVAGAMWGYDGRTFG